jgi:hypothetical protein
LASWFECQILISHSLANNCLIFYITSDRKKYPCYPILQRVNNNFVVHMNLEGPACAILVLISCKGTWRYDEEDGGANSLMWLSGGEAGSHHISSPISKWQSTHLGSNHIESVDTNDYIERFWVSFKPKSQLLKK